MNTKLLLAVLLAAACGSNSPLSLSVKTSRIATDLSAQIDHIHLVVDRMKLEGAAEVELKRGPFDVDLTGASLGSVEKVFDSTVPAGTYSELRFDISGISVEGTFGGEAFSFSTGLQLSQKKEGAFVVGAASSNITLSIDASKWFGALDPRDPANRASIESNIRTSFDAFQDDDGHGDDDHGEHADGGDGHGGQDDGGGRH
jgi:hypothetical protein